jgi:hypothetical protein
MPVRRGNMRPGGRDVCKHNLRRFVESRTGFVGYTVFLGCCCAPAVGNSTLLAAQQLLLVSDGRGFGIGVTLPHMVQCFLWKRDGKACCTAQWHLAMLRVESMAVAWGRDP